MTQVILIIQRNSSNTSIFKFTRESLLIFLTLKNNSCNFFEKDTVKSLTRQEEKITKSISLSKSQDIIN